jgi:hypothetical protein
MSTGVNNHSSIEQLSQVRWLLALHDAHLHWASSIAIIQLLGEQGSSALLIVGGGVTQPEVDDVLLASSLVRVGVQHDVRVAAVELAVLLLGHFDGLEVVDHPHLQLAVGVTDGGILDSLAGQQRGHIGSDFGGSSSDLGLTKFSRTENSYNQAVNFIVQYLRGLGNFPGGELGLECGGLHTLRHTLNRGRLRQAVL